MSGIKNRKDNLPLAVGMILFTVFALSLGDAFIKRFSSDFVLWQIFVVRSLIAVPCLLGFILVLDRDACILYELFYAWPIDGGTSWDASSGAVLFPFRTTAMLAGLLTIVVVSRLTQGRCPTRPLSALDPG